MNTILVPTDFSAAAENATTYAAHLAKKIKATVHLVHVYQIPVPMTDYPVLIVDNENLKAGVDEGLQKALEKMQASHTSVTFTGESRLGEVAAEIEEACREQNAFVLVVGTKDLSGFERFLFGDTTTSLIKHSSYPVLAVPESAGTDVPSNIVLATDLQQLATMPIDTIAAIVKKLGATLHVVHVDVQNENTESPAVLMQKLDDIQASFHTVKDDDVSEGLRQYVEQNNIDLVLVLPHEHSFYQRLFFKGHTQGILQALPVPVMSIR